MRGWGRVGALAWILASCGTASDDAGSGGDTGSGGVGSAPPASTTAMTGTESTRTQSSGDPTTGSTADDPTTTSSGGADPTSSTAGSADVSSTAGPSGLGELIGDCGVLDAAALTGDDPDFIINTLDFGGGGFDYDLLTPGAQAVFDAGNLGGSSLFSEVIAFDVLARCESAELLKTETEIEYDAEGTRTDLLVEFDGTKIGVSVTRGQGFPLEDPYSVEQAQALLEDKLSDIPLSTANVAPADAWDKQILHIIAYAPMHAQSLQTAYESLGAEFTLDTLVVVTVTDGEDLFIYTE